MAEDEKADCSNNAQLFRIAVSRNLKHIAESVSENEFLETLTFLKSKPSTAQKLHKAMIIELYNSMKSDFQNILQEGSLQDGFHKIAKLSEESTTSADIDAWRPPGNVTSHLRSLDAYKIKEATEELEKRVNAMEEENEVLMKTITESRLKIRATSDSTTKILNCTPLILQRLEKMHEQLTACLKTIQTE